MDELTARALLEKMVAADAVPTLDADEVQQLLTRAQRTDSAGLAPSDSNWTPTWDLNAAAAEGWRWKAGKVAGAYTFGDSGSTFNRSDMVKACMAMAKTYGSRGAGTIKLAASDAAWDTDIAGNVNV